MMHRRAVEVFPFQAVPAHPDKSGHTVESVQCREHPRLSAHETVSKPAQRQGGRGRIAHDAPAEVVGFEPNFAK